MVDNIKISVIMAVYNVAEYLEESINSLIHQTLNDIEIICIDDGSTDGSKKILEEFQKKDDRIKLYSLKSNSGTGVARNIALKMAKGKYIMILDPDDYLEQNACELAYNHIENNHNDFIIFNNYQYDEQTKIKQVYDKRIEPLKDFFSNKNFNINNITFPFFNMGSTWGYLYKREFINKYNIKYDRLRLNEDVNFLLLSYLNAASISILDLPLYNYRLNRKGASTLNTKLWKDIIKSKVKSLYLLEKYKNQINIKIFIPYIINSLVHYYHRFMYLDRKISLNYYNLMKKLLKKIDEKYNIKSLKDYVAYKDIQTILKISETRYYILSCIKILISNIFSITNTYINDTKIKTLKILFLKFYFKPKYQSINNPELSIIVTAYNQEKYIKECINKILSQTYKNFEIVCVNDCSKDNTKKVIEKLASRDKRIFVINNEENYGVSKSRNIGLKFAKGKYVIFHDGDDYFFKKTSLEIAIREMHNSQADVGIWGHLVYENNKLKDGHTIKKIRLFYENKNVDLLQLQTSMTYKIIKKYFLKNNNIKFTNNLSIAEDSMFSYMMHFHNPKYVLINDTLHVYRKHNNSATKNNPNILKNLFKTIKVFKNKKIFKAQDFELQLEIVKSWLDGCLYFYNSFDANNKIQLRTDVCKIIAYLNKFYGQNTLSQISSYKKLINEIKMYK